MSRLSTPAIGASLLIALVLGLALWRLLRPHNWLARTANRQLGPRLDAGELDRAQTLERARRCSVVAISALLGGLASIVLLEGAGDFLPLLAIMVTVIAGVCALYYWLCVPFRPKSLPQVPVPAGASVAERYLSQGGELWAWITEHPDGQFSVLASTNDARHTPTTFGPYRALRDAQIQAQAVSEGRIEIPMGSIPSGA